MTGPARREGPNAAAGEEGEAAVERSEAEGVGPGAEEGSDRPRSTWVGLRETLFGDRWGLALFLGTLALLVALWRVGFFIADSRTVANALVNVLDGHLAVTESPYSLTFGAQPGLVTAGGDAFGRNYGQVLLAVPFLLAGRLVALLVDPRLAIAAVLSLLVLGTTRELARAAGRPPVARGGRWLAILVFVLTLVPATDLPADRLPIMALQATTALAMAVSAVAMYRLVRLQRDGRAGLVAGVGLVLASPLTFWATVPKRHALTAAVVAVSLYWFARSRRPESTNRLALRAGPYVLVGLLASVQAFEAAYLLLVLVPVDLLTSPRNRPTELLAVAGALLVALLPTFIINALISGNPFKPPRALEPVAVDASFGDSLGSDFPTDGVGGGGSSGAGGSGGGGGSGTGGGGVGWRVPGPLVGLLDTVGRGVAFLGVVLSFLVESLQAGIDDLGRLGEQVHTFLRSGTVTEWGKGLNDHEAVELALLESMPLLAAAVWFPVAWGRRLVGRRVSIPPGPDGATDLLALAWTVVFVLVYLPYLPLGSQITVRYIVPTVPLLLYGLTRVEPLVRGVRAAPRWLAGGYLLGAVGGTLAITVVLAVLDPAVGEAMQFHALVNLGAAALLAAAVVSWGIHRREDVVAGAAGLAGGLTTALLVLAALEYVSYGRYAVDLVRVLAGAIPIL